MNNATNNSPAPTHRPGTRIVINDDVAAHGGKLGTILEHAECFSGGPGNRSKGVVQPIVQLDDHDSRLRFAFEPHQFTTLF